MNAYTFEYQKITGRASKRPLSGAIAAPVLAALLAAAALAAGGCSQRREAAQPPAPALERETSFDGLKATVRLEPGIARLDRDNLLTVVIETPTSVVARLAPIQDRLSGFAAAGALERDPVETRGTIRREYRFRLSPVPADEYRVGPIAVTYSPAGGAADAEESWFPTPPIELASEPAAEVKDGELRGIFGPQRVPPPPRVVAGYVLLALLAAAAGYGLWRLGKLARRAAIARRLSPRERALWELRELLAKNLVKKGRVKDFYVGITMIVRRYIERARGVRAPRQTTEEFLQTAAKNPAFTPQSLKKLGDFLAAADLVKYAALVPSDSEVNGAVNAAREYVESDSERPAAARTETGT